MFLVLLHAVYGNMIVFFLHSVQGEELQKHLNTLVMFSRAEIIVVAALVSS